jgi:catechol 2,3-dioxygenase-like lactoylglutathione lyase family enzyme
MKPRITVVTLGVDDLERAVRFYRDGLGWPTAGIVGTEFDQGAVAFFDLEGGLKLAGRMQPARSEDRPGASILGLFCVWLLWDYADLPFSVIAGLSDSSSTDN